MCANALLSTPRVLLHLQQLKTGDRNKISDVDFVRFPRIRGTDPEGTDGLLKANLPDLPIAEPAQWKQTRGYAPTEASVVLDGDSEIKRSRLRLGKPGR